MDCVQSCQTAFVLLRCSAVLTCDCSSSRRPSIPETVPCPGGAAVASFGLPLLRSQSTERIRALCFSDRPQALLPFASGTGLSLHKASCKAFESRSGCILFNPTRPAVGSLRNMSHSSYYQYQNQQEVFVAPNNVFGYVQYDPRRSKSPSSLINHSGRSPGPLNTPPLNRNDPRGPEPPPDHAPEHMVYDESFGSLSNSPTSVRTPEDTSFEVEMLDLPMRDLYRDQNGAMSSQVSQGTISPINTTMFLNSDGLFTDQGQYHIPSAKSVLTICSPPRGTRC